MRRVAVTNLRPGMKVAKPVYSSDCQMLLNTGVEIKESYIPRLQQMGILSLYITDDYCFPDLVIEDVVDQRTRNEAMKTVREVMNNIRIEGQRRAGQSAVLKVDDVSRIVSMLLDDLRSAPELMINMVDIRTLDDYTFGHSVNVCVLSLVTAISMGYDELCLVELGKGALLHDIGKGRVAAEILNKRGPLSPAEYEEVKKHPAIGFDILRQEPSVSLLAAHVAFQHHERYNGEGYPRGLQGKEIHDYARIVAVADVYDALVADRYHRKAHPPHEAVEMISGSGDYLFDYEVVKAFLENIAVYPVGSLVELSTGEVGVVSGVTRGFSFRPTVRLVRGASGLPVTGRQEINLLQRPTVFINRVLETVKA